MKEFWKTGARPAAARGHRLLHLVRRAQAGAEARGRAPEAHAVDGRQGQGQGAQALAQGRRQHRSRQAGHVLEADRALRRARRHDGRRVDVHEPREARGGRAGGRPGQGLRAVRPRRPQPLGAGGGGRCCGAFRRRLRRQVPGRQQRLRAQAGRGQGVPGRLLCGELVRQEALRPARPRPAARQARRRALARDHRPRWRLRARAHGGGRVGVHEAACRRAPAAGRWTACSARSRACGWTRSRARA